MMPGAFAWLNYTAHMLEWRCTCKAASALSRVGSDQLLWYFHHFMHGIAESCDLSLLSQMLEQCAS